MIDVQPAGGRVRVLHLIEDLGPGGAERLLYDNLRRLDRTRFDGIVCHLYDRDLHWRKPLLALGYPVESLHLRSIYDSPRGVLRLWKLLRRERVDLMHTHLYGANLIGRLAGRLRGVPVLSSLHNPDYDPAVLRDNPALSPAKLGVLRGADRASARVGRTRFVAVSQYVRDSAVEHLRIDPADAEVIYNAIDLDAFTPTGTGAARLRRELGLGSDDSVVLCVARLDPQKGLRYLVEAVPLIARQFPRVRVLLAGTGPPPLAKALADLADTLGVGGYVRLLGPRADVRDLLELCDVFVLPSLYEGLGIVLLEAMAMQRPCVACRTAAVPEVVMDNRSGLLVEPANPAELAAAIVRLLGDPALRARMGAEGRRIVAERFNAARNIAQLEFLYERLAAPSHSRGDHVHGVASRGVRL